MNLEIRATKIDQEVEKKADEEKVTKLKEEFKTEKEEIKVKEIRDKIIEIKEQEKIREKDERENRKNNILITGIKQETIKETGDLEEWIKVKMGVTVNIKRKRQNKEE